MARAGQALLGSILLLSGFLAGGLFFRGPAPFKNDERGCPPAVAIAAGDSEKTRASQSPGKEHFSSSRPLSLGQIRSAAREAESAWMRKSVYAYFPPSLDTDAEREEKIRAIKATNPVGTWLVGSQRFAAGEKETTVTFYLNFYDGEKAARANPRTIPSGEAADLCWFLAGFIVSGDRDSSFSTSTCRPTTAEKDGWPYLDINASIDFLLGETVSFILVPLESSKGTGSLRYLLVDQPNWQENSGFGWRLSSAKDFTRAQTAAQERMDLRNKEAFRQAK